jgi:hypothetical protein
MEAIGVQSARGDYYETLKSRKTGHCREALREDLGRMGIDLNMPPSYPEHGHRAELFVQLRQEKEAAFLREKAAALIQASKWAAAI